MAKQAVLLLAHGTPETVEQVPEYLRNVVSGRPVPPHVVEEIARRYALIGKSPLTEITFEQARLVEDELNGGEAGGVSHPGDKNKDVARVGHPESFDSHPFDKSRGVERMGQPESVSHPDDEDKGVARVGRPGLGMGGSRVRAYVGMRNWRPYIADVVRQMRADGVEQAAVVCMAPQNSRTSVGLYRRAVEAEAQGLRIDFTEAWARHPLLIEAFAERLRPAWTKLSEESGGPVPVLFTAHSVPRRTVEAAKGEGGSVSHPDDKSKDVARVEQPESFDSHAFDKNVERMGQQPYWPGQGADPYAEEARQTAELVAARVEGIPFWRFAFQSQGASGGEWIGPTVEETMDEIARDGVKALILQPIGFLCDHVEILYDVDRVFRDYASRIGLRLERPDSLNGSRTLARAVADLAQKGLARVAASQQSGA